MPRTRPPYPPEYRQKMVELVRAGRTPEELPREFEPTAASIHKWVKQADLDEGRRHDGMTTAQREEITRLRHENRQLRLDREILDTQRDFEFVKANQANYPVAMMCRLLEVSTSAPYGVPVGTTRGSSDHLRLVRARTPALPRGSVGSICVREAPMARRASTPN